VVSVAAASVGAVCGSEAGGAVAAGGGEAGAAAAAAAAAAAGDGRAGGGGALAAGGAAAAGVAASSAVGGGACPSAVASTSACALVVLYCSYPADSFKSGSGVPASYCSTSAVRACREPSITWITAEERKKGTVREERVSER
jgi:hypothetical protein